MSWIRHASLPDDFPSPKYSSGGITMSTFVDGGRNQNGDFIGQVIGNDKQKIDIEFAALTPAQTKAWLSLFDRRVGGKFVADFEVFDAVLNRFTTKTFYVGDRTMQPFRLDDGDTPEYFLNLKANLIEV